MIGRILCVDDEPNVLEAFERQFRKDFDIQTAQGPELGLRAISENGPFAVVVSDLRMPDMDGIEFLSRVRQVSPDTVRMILTGNADLQAAIMAVNEGHVFQFLTKPCPPEMFIRAVTSAIEQYRLITAERELLEDTLRGSIGIMSEILSLANPPAFSRSQRIRRYVRQMAENMDLADVWQYELAAMLSQIGCVAVPADILDRYYNREALTPKEQEIVSSQSRVGHDLLIKIRRLDVVAEMVAHQQCSWSDSQSDQGSARIGAHLLKVALDFDQRLTSGNSVDSVILQMRASRDYNPAFVRALEQLHIEQAERETRFVKLSELRPHMIVNSPVCSRNGLPLLAIGQVITNSAIARLNSFASLFGVVEPISVTVPHAEESTTAAELERAVA